MNNINTSGKLKINRGVELLLQNKKEIPEPDLNQNKFIFEKNISLFKKEVKFKIEFRIKNKT